jgi:tetratricopeptide (TPR) repeat protein
MPAATIAKDIVCNLAYISQQEGEYGRAAYLFSIAALLAPQDADVLHGAGFSKRKIGDLEGSREDLERAVKLRPEDPALWYELGLTIAAMRKGAEARPVFEKVLALDPAYAWAHYDLACLDALEGNSDAAFANLNRAIECGFRNLTHLERDEDFRSVREDPRWKEILEKILKNVDNRTRGCLVFESQGSQRVQ